eukprot:676835-Pelagomonas_calceolata.AAC.2
MLTPPVGQNAAYLCVATVGSVAFPFAWATRIARTGCQPHAAHGGSQRQEESCPKAASHCRWVGIQEDSLNGRDWPSLLTAERFRQREGRQGRAATKSLPSMRCSKKRRHHGEHPSASCFPTAGLHCSPRACRPSKHSMETCAQTSVHTHRRATVPQ